MNNLHFPVCIGAKIQPLVESYFEFAITDFRAERHTLDLYGEMSGEF